VRSCVRLVSTPRSTGGVLKSRFGDLVGEEPGSMRGCGCVYSDKEAEEASLLAAGCSRSPWKSICKYTMGESRPIF
jgi:hypothetical protein